MEKKIQGSLSFCSKMWREKINQVSKDLFYSSKEMFKLVLCKERKLV